MCVVDDITLNLQELLTGTRQFDINVIRRHSRRLEQLGDISFPLSIKNWYHLIDTNKLEATSSVHNIFDYNVSQSELNIQIEELKEKSKNWQIDIERVDVKDNDVHLFLRRSKCFLKSGIEQVLTRKEAYGSNELIQKEISLDFDCDIKIDNVDKVDISTLRMLILKDVTLNLVRFMSKHKTSGSCKIVLTSSSVKQSEACILCGPVLNNHGVKDNRTKAEEILSKRASDMRMMAQHKYGIQVKPNDSWKVYFETLGKAAVRIEMLSNKPHKALKLVMTDLQTTHKGASFIFYNCARLAVLFKELQKRIAQNIYPELPDIENVDFSLLNQPEEWELFYVYILQFPITVKNCIRDIEKGIINPQYLVSFLSSLCSVFSAYYRRVRILTDPRDHLFATLYARVYLLKALQCVFHNALALLNIEPIKEM